MSLIFYGMLAYLLFHPLCHLPGTWTTVVVILATLVGGIGLSRIYLGVHYPSDIIAGFLASGIWLLAVIGTTEVSR